MRWPGGFGGFFVSLIGGFFLLIWVADSMTRGPAEPAPAAAEVSGVELPRPEETEAKRSGARAQALTAELGALAGSSIVAEAAQQAELALAEDSSADWAGAVTVQEAAARIRDSGPALVILFGVHCSLSRRAFPQFVEISESLSSRVEILAFSTDRDEGEVNDFLWKNDASFAADRLAPWAPGELGDVAESVGLKIGSVWIRPLIAVIGNDGRVLGQWQGLTNLRPVEETLSRAGL